MCSRAFDEAEAAERILILDDLWQKKLRAVRIA